MSRRAFARLNRRAQRPDANQADVDRALRRECATVEPGECWDRWVYLPGRSPLAQRVIALEVKDGAKPPSARRLTEREIGFAQRWPGPGAVVKGVEEALAALRAAERGELPSTRVAAEAYRDATEPGWRRKDALRLAGLHRRARGAR